MKKELGRGRKLRRNSGHEHGAEARPFSFVTEFISFETAPFSSASFRLGVGKKDKASYDGEFPAMGRG